MRYCSIPVTIFNQNCSLVWCEQTKEAVLVDPGGEAQRLRKKIALMGLIIKEIWLTHGHLDHVGAAKELSIYYDIPIIGPHRQEKLLLTNLPKQCRMFGVENISPLVPDKWLDHGDMVRVGKSVFNVIYCPGHSPGHIVLWNKAHKFVLMGDVLFNGNIGSTNLPGGNRDTLMHSIRNNIMTLSDDIHFLPGHGFMSTIGYERRNNPFLQK